MNNQGFPAPPSQKIENPFIELVLKNPSRPSIQNWQPETLPAEKKAGPFTLTLEKFRAQTNNAMPLFAGMRYPSVTITGELKLSGEIPGQEKWQVTGLRAVDATGNESTRQSLQPGRPYTVFGNEVIATNHSFTQSINLDAREVWTLYAQVAKTAGFKEGEIWKVEGIGNGATRPMSKSVHGVQVSGFFYLTTGQLTADFQQLPDNIYPTLIKVLDQYGNELPPRHPGMSSFQSKHLIFPFKSGSSPSSVTMVIGFSKAYETSFVVDPREAVKKTSSAQK